MYQWVASRILQHIVAALAKDYGHYLRAAPRFEVCGKQRSNEIINQGFLTAAPAQATSHPEFPTGLALHLRGIY